MATQNNEGELQRLCRKKVAAKRQAKLFLFTEAEERAMRRAIHDSKRRMRTFGLAPAQPMIDLSHYVISKPSEECHQEKNTK